jgi:hypothetical protein
MFFTNSWAQFPAGSVVRNIIREGYKISFPQFPTLFNGVRNTLLVGKYADVLLQEVEFLLAKRAIEIVPFS